MSSPLEEIYEQFTPGSVGFCKAVSEQCGFDLSPDEIARIAERAGSADQFEDIYNNEDWWKE